MSWRDPLAGPGPSGPADTGTPVSATVGVMTGMGTGATAVGRLGSCGIGGLGADKGMGAGDWLSVLGLIGGDWEEGRGWLGPPPIGALVGSGILADTGVWLLAWLDTSEWMLDSSLA